MEITCASFGLSYYIIFINIIVFKDIIGAQDHNSFHKVYLDIAIYRTSLELPLLLHIIFEKQNISNLIG